MFSETIYQNKKGPIYYVYAYLRDKDSETALAGTPYYIGKGHNSRAFSKHKNVSIPINNENIVLLETNLTELGAFALERRYIRWYGRKDLGTGILLNKTDGGDGIAGQVFTEETKEKMSKVKIGSIHTEETKEKISIGGRGKTRTHEQRERLSMCKTGENNPMYGKEFTDDHKIKISNGNSGKKRTKEYKNRRSIEMSGSNNPMFGIALSQDHREKISQSCIGKSKSEETKKKMSMAKSKPQNQVTCPYCNKTGGQSNMTRFHFENCPHKLVEK